MKPYFRLLTGRIEKATEGSAAFDLFYVGEHPIILGDSPIAIPTGVTTEFSPSLVAIIKEKSGLALKGVELKAGVIDSDYRDEWKVVARFPVPERNLLSFVNDQATVEHFRIDPGMKIAQVILVDIPVVYFSFEHGAEVVFKDAIREGGFGSTGK